MVLHSLSSTTPCSPRLPGELGQAFKDVGGFPIIVIAMVVGLVIGMVPHDSLVRSTRFQKKLVTTKNSFE
jgi:hypothetical protein